MKKKALITLTVALSTLAVMGQQSTIKSDTTSFKIGNTKFIIVENDNDSSDVDEPKVKEKEFNSWSGIDLGVNGLLTADGSTSLPKDLNYMELDYAKSLVWNLNIVDASWDWVDSDKKDEQIKNTGFGIISGLGLSYRSYSFENNTRLLNVNDSTFGYIDTTVNYHKNKLRTAYLRMPLMLQFYTKRRKENEIKTGFHFAAGVVGGVRVGNVYKRKYKINGDETKDKIRDDFNLSPIILDAEVRLGYGDLSFFASYGLTPLFEKNKGPELYPITMGISLTRLI